MMILDVLSDVWDTVSSSWNLARTFFASGFSAFLALGVSGALVAATITYVRDTLAGTRLRRTELSSGQIAAVAFKLQSRLHPSGADDLADQSDSALMLSTFRLTTAMPGRRNRRLRNYIHEVERVVRFGQPAPDSARLLKDLVMQLGKWTRRPGAMRRSLRVASRHSNSEAWHRIGG